MQLANIWKIAYNYSGIKLCLDSLSTSQEYLLAGLLNLIFSQKILIAPFQKFPIYIHVLNFGGRLMVV